MSVDLAMREIGSLVIEQAIISPDNLPPLSLTHHNDQETQAYHSLHFNVCPLTKCLKTKQALICVTVQCSKHLM